MRYLNERRVKEKETMAKQITEEQKQQALSNAVRSVNARIDADQKIRRNSFSEWGNDKCISRTKDTIRDMKNGYASDRQYQYWLNH